jgi:hypothetical protein
MIGFDFTYPPGQRTGTPPPGMIQARWYAWSKNRLSTANAAARAAELLDDSLQEVAPPQRSRMTVLDMENQGIINGAYDHALRERIVTAFLEQWRRLSPAKIVVIDWWPGIPPTFNYVQILAALEGTEQTRTARANRDRDKMFDLARRHREIVKMAGMVTVLGVIHRPDGSSGPNGKYGTTFYLRDIAVRARFYHAAYPGAPLNLWTAGGYTGVPGFPEISREDRERLLDAAWAAKYDSISNYGELAQSATLGQALSARLLAQAG